MTRGMARVKVTMPLSPLQLCRMLSCTLRMFANVVDYNLAYLHTSVLNGLLYNRIDIDLFVLDV